MFIDPFNDPSLNNSGGSGSVTSVSVATSNGFAGTVANPTSTPAITVSTSVTGVLKGNGTAISAATSGTDYLAPFGSQTANNVYAAPSGSAGNPTFRALVLGDLPSIAAGTILGNNNLSANTPSALTGTAISAMLSAATTAVQGVVTLATNAQVVTGTDTAKPIVPSALLNLFKAGSSAANGYAQFPVNFGSGFGNLMVQWGVTASLTTGANTISFPTAFTTSCFSVVITQNSSGIAQAQSTASSFTTSNFSLTNNATVSSTFSWIAIGI